MFVYILVLQLVYVWEAEEKKEQTPSKSALCLNLLCMDTPTSDFQEVSSSPRVGDNNYTFDYLVIMHCSHFVIAHMIKV